MLFTLSFWSEAFSRALRTFAQTMLAGFGGSALNIWTASWHQIIGLSAGASVLSILMTIDRTGLLPSAAPAEPAHQISGGCGDQLR
jgi:hypothetical protein